VVHRLGAVQARRHLGTESNTAEFATARQFYVKPSCTIKDFINDTAYPDRCLFS